MPTIKLIRIVSFVSAYILILFWANFILARALGLFHINFYHSQMWVLRIIPRIVGIVFVIWLSRKLDKFSISDLGLKFNQGWLVRFLKGLAIGVLSITALVVIYKFLYNVNFLSSPSLPQVLTAFGLGLLI